MQDTFQQLDSFLLSHQKFWRFEPSFLAMMINYLGKLNTLSCANGLLNFALNKLKS